MAASGAQAEAALKAAVANNAGKYVLVVEGAIPARNNGVYMELVGRPGVQVLREVASQAAAVVAIGSCASWGGVPSADPNPTGAVGVDAVVSDKPIVNRPGCPPNPYNLLAVVLEYVTMGRLPQLDEYSRPKFAYYRVIHENCPRRAHFDAGRFATAFGDEWHRKGWCLYKLGCKTARLPRQSAMKKVLIGGIGNVLLGDDGVGPYVVRLLAGQHEFDEGVEVVDLGTPALELVDQISGKDAVIFVDSVKLKAIPGDVLRYNKTFIKRQCLEVRTDPHSPALVETLLSARLFGSAPGELLLLGVVGKSIKWVVG